MGASAAALLLVATGFLTYEFFTRRQSLTQELSTLAEIVGAQSTAALAYDDQAVAREVLHSLRAKEHIVSAGLYKDGRLFAEYHSSQQAEVALPATPATGVIFHDNHLALGQDIWLKDEMIGTVYLESDLSEIRDRLREYAAIASLMLLASGALTYLLSARLQRIISEPILGLAATAKAVSNQKDYSLRATQQSNDELGQLIEGFNEMLAQIQNRDTALQGAYGELEQRVQDRTRDLQAEVQERRKTEEALRQQFGRTNLLNRITQIIAERQDAESILHVVLRQLEDNLKLDLGLVALFDPQAQTLNLAASRVKNSLLASKLDLPVGTVCPLAQSGLAACQQRQTLYIPDTLKVSACLPERLAGAGLRSAVAVPLLVEGELFGVLVAARLQADGFGSGDSEFLRMLGEHVALAAHHARLYGDLETAYEELHQTQQTVMQQERLKALGQMASGIAHDVNNALSPIVGFTDMMLKYESGLSSNALRYLKHIRTAGEDIAHIVARLREFYRRRDDREKLQELNLNVLAEQVVDMTRPRWRDIPQSNGVTVEVGLELAPTVPELAGIESEVREALTNLLLNAVDALPRGGAITIRTRVTECEAPPGSAKPHQHVVVEVTDTGIGMNAETLRRCLEPFFSTKGKRGTGLGLAMVYGVMERHDGLVTVESELGKGSTFRLSFPVRKLQTSGSDTKQIRATVSPLRVLCIDDEPLVRDLLKEMLEREGHQVTLCDGGQAGVETCRAEHTQGHGFDIVITDLGMPYVDGRQVAAILKREFPDMPMVMLTGWGAFMKEDGSAPVQVDSVLSKPPRSRELCETLSRLTSSKNGKPARAAAPV